MEHDSRAHIQGAICRFLSDMLGQPVAPHDELRAKGLESVGFLELVIFIEKQFHLPLPLQLLSSTPVTTVEALVEQLVTARPSATGVR
ncbi:MAG: phosphopantetheine-binding protein [Pseudomonadota bacterium]|jgi:acyl carrier protein